MKKNILLVLITTIIVGSIGVYAGTRFSANEISYEPTNNTWNIETVAEALDQLYNLKFKEITACYAGNRWGSCSNYNFTTQTRVMGDNTNGTYIKVTYSSNMFSVYANADGKYYLVDANGNVSLNTYKKNDLITKTPSCASGFPAVIIIAM